jgi:MFS family permease
MEQKFRLRSNINLRNFLSARFLFILAMQMVTFALAWHVYDLTRSALALGWLGLSEVVPAIGLALYAGHSIDRSDKRNMLLYGMIAYFIAVGLLCFVTSSYSEQHFGKTVVQLLIYFLIFCTGIFRAFTGPTFHAIVAQLVQSKDQLPKAITWSSTVWTAAAVTGPVLSGLLISLIGTTQMFFASIGLLAAALFFATRIPNLPVLHNDLLLRPWESMKQGLRFVWSTKEVLSALSVDMFAVLFGGATALLPVFANEILHVDATKTGMLKAAQGVGTVLILSIMTKFPLKKNQGRLMLQAVALFGICIIVFAISKSFWLSFTALFFAGVFDGLSVVVRSTIIQLYVPDEMRGRVSSVNSMFINSSNELGQFESGLAAKIMTTVPSVIFGGCMTILVVSIAWLKAPKLRKLEY